MRATGLKAVFIVCGALAVFSFSCSQKKPEIRSTNVQLLRVQGPAGKFVERLSVFVFFTDADGNADFGSMSITHEETGLSWNMPASSCMTRQRGKDLWTGSNSLAGPGDEPLPEGEYTIAIFDLAGNETDTSFTLARPSFPDFAPVSFNIAGGQWSLAWNTAVTGFSRTWLFLYDDRQNLVYSWRVPDSQDGHASGTVAALKAFAQNAVSVQCFVENQSGSAGVLLSPVTME